MPVNGNTIAARPPRSFVHSTGRFITGVILDKKQHAAGLVADFDRVEKSTDIALATVIDDFESVQPTDNRTGRDAMGARDALNRLRTNLHQHLITAYHNYHLAGIGIAQWTRFMEVKAGTFNVISFVISHS